MCGRFVRTSPQEIIASEFGVSQFASGVDLRPRYNVCPGEEVPAIVRVGDEKRLGPLRWGFVPRGAKDPSSGVRAINARGETVATKPAFRDAFRRRRCLIVADGFYEWRKQGRARIPFFIRPRSAQPFTFAALWDRWISPEGKLLHTCSIITCPANELVAEIHDRMPVILAADGRERWLDPEVEDPVRLLPLLKPCPPQTMEAYEVSRLVNSPRNDSPDCTRPIVAVGGAEKGETR